MKINHKGEQSRLEIILIERSEVLRYPRVIWNDLPFEKEDQPEDPELFFFAPIEKDISRFEQIAPDNIDSNLFHCFRCLKNDKDQVVGVRQRIELGEASYRFHIWLFRPKGPAEVVDLRGGLFDRIETNISYTCFKEFTIEDKKSKYFDISEDGRPPRPMTEQEKRVLWMI